MTQDEKERNRLEKIFGMDRAKASERIVATSEKHDSILKTEMSNLGVAF